MISLENCKAISLKKIQDSFSRVAGCYEKYADLQNILGEELLEQVLACERDYRHILDIGCGPGRLLKKLKVFFPESRLVGFDLSREMLRQVSCAKIHLLAGDAVSLPFKDSFFDLLLSGATYQWVRDLPVAFREASRILRDGGDFIFSCFGSQTLSELRSCLGIENNPLPEAEFVEEVLKGAGFSDIELKVKRRKKHFDNLVALLSWLKYIGANQISHYQPLLTPARLTQANNFYCSNYSSNGKVYPVRDTKQLTGSATVSNGVYASFEVIQVKAKKAVYGL